MSTREVTGMKALFDAVQLEAIYRMVRQRGYKGGRYQFMVWASGIVDDMRARGEIP